LEIQKVIFLQFYLDVLLIIYLSQQKTNCNPFAHQATTLENVTALACEMLNLFI